MTTTASNPTQSVPAGLGDAELARRLYPDGPMLTRFIQRHRHRICPLGLLARQVPEGSRVLDVGCGGGLLAAHLVASGRAVEVHGIDASRPAIEIAQSMSQRLKDVAPGAGVQFEHRQVQDGLPDALFDVVCLIDVLHHVPVEAQERAFLDAASRVRPGGVFLYKDMADGPVWCSGMNRLHDLVMARQWIRYVPVERAEGWGERAGLRLERSEDVRMLWYAHEMRVFRRDLEGDS